MSTPFRYILSGETWALLRGEKVHNYIRWSESAEQWVDMKGRELGKGLEAAKDRLIWLMCEDYL
jgi:hypothetical protein